MKVSLRVLSKQHSNDNAKTIDNAFDFVDEL